MSSARRTLFVPHRAVALLLVGAALAWLLRSVAPDATGRPGATPSGATAAAADPEGTLMQPVQRQPTGRVVAPSAQEPEPDNDLADGTSRFSGSRSIRVVGRVRRNGEPVDDAALSFRAPGPSGREVDWDITDEDGRFEVYLASAGYVVTCEEDEGLVARIHVPAQVDAWTYDLDLSCER